MKKESLRNLFLPFFSGFEETEAKNSIVVVKIGKMLDPVPQGDGILPPVFDLKFFQDRLVAMPKDHGIRFSLDLFGRKVVEDHGEPLRRMPGLLLARGGTGGGDFPEERKGGEALKAVNQRASQKSAQPEVADIRSVHRIPV